jgi:hypothetical protein
VQPWLHLSLRMWLRSACGFCSLSPIPFASVVQASDFRADVTGFRPNASARPKAGSEPAFRRNTAERAYTTEAAHNPEVAGSNPAPATAKGPGNSVYERHGVRLEVAFLDHGEWPQNSFERDVAEVAGVRARVVSLSSLRADKAMLSDDESVAAKDRADSVTLGEFPASAPSPTSGSLMRLDAQSSAAINAARRGHERTTSPRSGRGRRSWPLRRPRKAVF